MEPLAMGKIIFSGFFNNASSEDQDTCVLEYYSHVLELITDCCVHRLVTVAHAITCSILNS